MTDPDHALPPLLHLPVKNINEVASPALLLYVERVEENIRRTLAISGGPENLRPHVKTHKCAEILRMQMDVEISKFKCATIAEAEMCAMSGAPDVLLAYQPVGPHVGRLMKLVVAYPETRFACVADNSATVAELAAAATAQKHRLRVFIDIDCGQRRTGISPGPDAAALFQQIKSSESLEASGLHVYDGHIHESDLAERREKCERAFAPIELFRRELSGKAPPLIVAGGTPTFPFHAKREGVECSPGTNVLWDAGYGRAFRDLDFLPAAWLLARVVSKPGANRLCLDLGHKSVASESPHPRVIFPALPDAKPVMHNEEHLVLETERAGEFKVGDPFYGVPWHVCPTVALHQEFVVVKDGAAIGAWRVASRDRRIRI